MNKLVILALVISFSFSQGNIDSKKYNDLVKKTTKESFSNMVKEYKLNASKNYKNLQESDFNMRKKYGIKGVNSKSRKEYKIKFIEDKFFVIKSLLEIQDLFLNSKDLNSLFISILELKALFKNNQKITKAQVERYRTRLEKNNRNSNSVKFYDYKNKFSLEINKIQTCYLTAIDFMAYSKCEKKLNVLQNSEKIERFIKNYMK